MASDPVWESQPIRITRNNKKISLEKRIIARAMLHNGGSERKVASLVGISPSAVHKVREDIHLSPEFVTHLKDSLPGKYYKLAHEALENISPEKLEKMNGYQLILTSKISADAGRMCEGLPTQIIQTKTLAVTLRGEIESLRRKKGEIMATLGGSSHDLPSSVPSRKVRENFKRV